MGWHSGPGPGIIGESPEKKEKELILAKQLGSLGEISISRGKMTRTFRGAPKKKTSNIAASNSASEPRAGKKKR